MRPLIGLNLKRKDSFLRCLSKIVEDVYILLARATFSRHYNVHNEYANADHQSKELS